MRIPPGISYDTKISSSPAVDSSRKDHARAQNSENKARGARQKKTEERERERGDRGEEERSGGTGEREEVTSRESNEPRLAAIRRPNRAILMNSSH